VTDSETAAWIGETFTSDAGWDHLETLVDIGNRMAGQSGEREALEATRDAFADAGCRDARIEEFEIQGWVRGDARVETPHGSQECIALPRSPAGETSGELVDVGAGLPDDFREAELDGKIALVSTTVPDWYDRFVHRREKYYHAVAAGAAGFIFHNHVEGCLPPTGSVGTSDAPIGEIPAVGVSREVGARLARRATGEQVSLTVDCETPEATSGNATAVIGPDTDEELLVTSHADAHDIAEGAMDNGAGTATIVEIATALARRAEDLETKVRFVAFGAEEVGLVGSTVESDRVDHDRIKAVVNADSNVFGRTLRLTTHGVDELGAAARRVADRFDHPIEVVPERPLAVRPPRCPRLHDQREDGGSRPRLRPHVRGHLREAGTTEPARTGDPADRARRRLSAVVRRGRTARGVRDRRRAGSGRAGRGDEDHRRLAVLIDALNAFGRRCRRQ